MRVENALDFDLAWTIQQTSGAVGICAELVQVGRMVGLEGDADVVFVFLLILYL